MNDSKITQKRYVLLNALLRGGQIRTTLNVGREALSILGEETNRLGKPHSSWAIRDWVGDGLRDLVRLKLVERTQETDLGDLKGPRKLYIFTITEEGRQALQGCGAMPESSRKVGPSY